MDTTEHNYISETICRLPANVRNHPAVTIKDRGDGTIGMVGHSVETHFIDGKVLVTGYDVSKYGYINWMENYDRACSIFADAITKEFNRVYNK